MKLFLSVFLLFFIYSVFGWIIETTYCSIKAKKKILSRGFLMGPYIPIYGTCAIVMIFLLDEYKNDLFVLFSMAVVYASIIEYLTSLWMEKVFHARWWNYTHEKFNVNGRICLKNSVLFGLLGCLLIYVINPEITKILEQIPENILEILSILFLILFLLDSIITISILLKLNIKIKNIKSDATEEIDAQIKKLLRHHRPFYNHLLKAFPKIEFTGKYGYILTKRIQSRVAEVNQFLKRRKKEMKELKKKIKENKINQKNREFIKKEKEKIKELKRKKIN